MVTHSRLFLSFYAAAEAEEDAEHESTGKSCSELSGVGSPWLCVYGSCAGSAPQPAPLPQPGAPDLLVMGRGVGMPGASLDSLVNPGNRPSKAPLRDLGLSRQLPWHRGQHFWVQPGRYRRDPQPQ